MKRVSFIRIVSALAALMWLGGAGKCFAQAGATPVAKVAISVGEAVRIAPSGQPQALQVGAVLQAGDRVRTGPDAVAILVFADEGRISLRADSELLIKHYEIDPAGVKTRIELELLRGTLRQISGHGSRQQPERYRLNTPIAVIGVRGTDFLARTGGDAVEAFVHEGNIVLTPKAEACAAACDPVAIGSTLSGSRYVRVSAAGQVEFREFRPGELEKVFGVELARAVRSNGASSTSIARAGAPDFRLPAGAQFLTESIFVAGGPDDLMSPGRSVAVSTNAAAQVPGAPVEVLSRQLVWGRFIGASSLAAENLLPSGLVREGRHVAVGEVGEYALWRTNPSGPMDPSLTGVATFALVGGSAELVQPSGLSAADIRSASLRVNFSQASFEAAVNLWHAATQDQSLNVAGKVSADGLFVGVNQSERVAGALSRDGAQAGYLFSKDVAAGTLRGLTLWRRP